MKSHMRLPRLSMYLPGYLTVLQSTRISRPPVTSLPAQLMIARIFATGTHPVATRARDTWPRAQTRAPRSIFRLLPQRST